MRQIVEFAVLWGLLFAVTFGVSLLDHGLIVRLAVATPVVGLILYAYRRLRKA
jgi:hypothetical protein